MELDKVHKTLKSLHLDEYFQKFKDKKLDDLVVQNFISNEYVVETVLKDFIPVIHHRKAFITAFKAATDEQPGPSTMFRNTGCPDDVPLPPAAPTVESEQESQARRYLDDARQMYRNSVESVLHVASFDINHFDFQAKKEEEAISAEFMSKLSEIKPELDVDKIKQLSKELQFFMGTCYAENFDRFKKQTPHMKLKAAVTWVTDTYETEMGRHLESKQYIQQFHELSNAAKTQAINAPQITQLALSRTEMEQLVQAMAVVESKFEDLNLLRTPQKSTAIGIDLGTTYTCVSVCINGEVTIIPNLLGNTTTPSYVTFRENHDAVVGENAILEEPINTCFDSKRLIGRSFSDKVVQEDLKVWPFKVIKADNTDTPKIEIRGKTYYSEEIAARILSYMKEIAEIYLGVKVKNAVITVPAYFNNMQRQATKDAGEIAGLNVLKIINEPTAAAIAYHLHRKRDLKKNALIFDLGGGTIDVTVLTMCEGEILVKSVGGDTHLGGQDFDKELINYVIQEFEKEHKINLSEIPMPFSSKVLMRLRKECQTHKCFLSVAKDTTIKIDAIYQGKDLAVKITREKFEELNHSHFEKCMAIVDQAISDSTFSKDEIDDIVLVGGSTRIPKIQEMLINLFENKKTLTHTINPEEAVARGAAIHASILNAEKNGQGLRAKERLTVIKEVTSHSLGIQELGEKFVVCIPKNTAIPCERKNGWRTSSDNQTVVRFKIFEGEDPISTKNQWLEEFTVEDIPPAKKGEEKLESTMEIDDEGIIHVKAVANSNRKFGAVTISSLQGRLSRKLISELKLPERKVRLKHYSDS